MGEPKLISYFVAYRVGPECGNAAIQIPEPITHAGFIKQIELYLRDQFIKGGIPEAEVGNVVVTNWQRFEEKEEPCIIQR